MKKSKKLFMIMVAGLVISGMFSIFYVKSKISSIHALRSSLSEIASKVSDTGELRDARGMEFSALFPGKSDIAGFMEDIYLISKKYDIKNLNFEQKEKELFDLGSGALVKAMPASGKKTDVMYSYPVRLSFYSGYRGQAEFIREIQNMKRLVTIRNLKVRRDEGLLATDLVVSIYSAEAR